MASETDIATWLQKCLGIKGSVRPFPWQQDLFSRLRAGTIERALDIPTGLGKTGVMALWLVARACGAKLPRRLVYVVDRRAVVDQATDVARHLRACVDDDESLRTALDLAPDRSLPISTLRGQHVDNREWLEDPTSVAIIVGTVDMIGSRLFFSGYGTTRKMRPYHAGLLGVDTLVVLDEVHLVPPFEKLLEAVAEGAATFGPKDPTLGALLPAFKLMSLSATGRTGQHKPFGLTEADLRTGTVTWKRLDAPKRLMVSQRGNDERLADTLAERAWTLSDDGAAPMRFIIFADQRKVAEATRKSLERLSSRDSKADEIDTELFVGGRRVFEREQAARRLADLGFIAGNIVARDRPAFLIATSAAEVGVDLDADHMVCDLVAWERMVQRLGRVNRRGDGDAEVHVIVEPPSADVDDARQKRSENVELSAKDENLVKRADRHDAVRALFEHLPLVGSNARDASPGALRRLKLDADQRVLDLLDVATTPAPLRPALSRALVDAWSMTSLKEHSGRPELGPWLRGWIEDDPPRTAVAWRTHLPVRNGRALPDSKEIEAFFEAAAPHQSELLETETYRVQQWLMARAGAALKAPAIDVSAEPSPPMPGEDRALPNQDARLHLDDVVAIVLSGSEDLRSVLRLRQLICDDAEARGRKAHEEKLQRSLAGGTVIVDVRLGGLDVGLLDEQSRERPRTVDDGSPWMLARAGPTDNAAMDAAAPVVRFRVRLVDGTQPVVRDSWWRERHRFAMDLSEDVEVRRWLIIEKWRHDAATEEDRAAGRPQLLTEHQRWTQNHVRTLAAQLHLPGPYRQMLETAARLHDEGKRAKAWQRAFNAPGDGVYAKTRGPLNVSLLDGYRHEFGSLPHAEDDPDLCDLPVELRELALHLIAAHHGFARPVITTQGCEDAPPSCLEERARAVALRFARLQRQWGPWGLAWWEALLRAADQQASRANDASDVAPLKEAV